MRPLALASLTLLLVAQPGFSATTCEIVDYPDRTEVVCVGDEKNPPEPAAPAVSAAPSVATAIRGKQPASVPTGEAASTRASAAAKAGAVTPTGPATMTGPSPGQDKAAARQAKRRELAGRTTRNLNAVQERPPSLR